MNWRLWQREVDMKLQSRGEDATRLYRFCMEERALFMKLLDYLGLEIADPPPPSPAIVIRKKKTARNR